jgi:hypothetical protein
MYNLGFFYKRNLPKSLVNNRRATDSHILLETRAHDIGVASTTPDRMKVSQAYRWVVRFQCSTAP